MNQHGMQQMSNVPGGMGISPMMQQPSPQQAQPQQQQQSSAGPQTSQPTPPQQSAMPNPPNAPVQQQSTERLDNITKVKGLAGPLRESLAVRMHDYQQYILSNSISTVDHAQNGRPVAATQQSHRQWDDERRRQQSNAALRQTFGGILFDLWSNWAAYGEWFFGKGFQPNAS